ncbi:MAG: right-handed parallel beta-helix repeat-containing protein, partial [bacterium]|nr:right-handed parallel beta-helix repeat-containing protein [bacterium]
NNATNDGDSTGLVATDGTLTIQNNTFSQNSVGLKLDSAGGSHSFTVSNNTFTDNALEAIDVNSVFPTFSGNTAENNGTNGILYQGSISQNYSFVANLPYKISTGLSVNASTTLTLTAGTILKFTNSGSLTIQGQLTAVGTSANKIIFTSIKDDLYGGDTNNDGVTTTATSSDWGGIHLSNATATSTISNAIVSYGTTGLKLTNSSAILDAITFLKNALGIQAIGTATTSASNIVFDGNTTDDDPASLIP